MIDEATKKGLILLINLTRSSVADISKLPNEPGSRRPYKEICRTLYGKAKALIESNSELKPLGVGFPLDINSSIYTVEAELRILRSFLDGVETTITDEIKLTKDIIVMDGQSFTATNALTGILSQATKQIKIIDSYLSPASLSILEAGVNVNVDLSIITSDTNTSKFNAFVAASKIFIKGRSKSKYEVHLSSYFHDRFIIIDNIFVWHCGPSIDMLGINKVGVISQLTDTDLIKSTVGLFDTEWNKSTVVSI